MRFRSQVLVALFLGLPVRAGCLSQDPGPAQAPPTGDSSSPSAPEPSDASEPTVTSPNPSSPPPSSPGPVPSANPPPTDPSPAAIDPFLVSLETSPVQRRAECPCAEATFEVELPDGGEGDTDLWLLLTVQWNGTVTPGFEISIELPDGAREEGRRGFDGRLVKVIAPEAGSYRLRLAGMGPVELTTRLVDRTPERATPEAVLAPLDVLPNLVTPVPLDVGIAPCDGYERAEFGAERCLRLTNAVGNLGTVPLEVRLRLPDGVLAISEVVEGHFYQRVQLDSGLFRDVLVAPAAFHPTHTHFHYTDFAGFELFAYDPSTGLRGASVGSMHKSGFCFIDIGRMNEPGVPPASVASYTGVGCLAPMPAEWVMGVSVGWYDEYHSGLSEQFVEISGVEDGFYELVSTANVEGTLLETDLTDNAASVVIELNGDSVRIVEGRAFYSRQ